MRLFMYKLLGLAVIWLFIFGTYRFDFAFYTTLKLFAMFFLFDPFFDTTPLSSDTTRR